MARVRITVAAQNDAEHIAQWIAQNNELAADQWLEDLHRKFERLSETPGMGTDRSDLGLRLRSSPLGNYLVFYRPRAWPYFVAIPEEPPP